MQDVKTHLELRHQSFDGKEEFTRIGMCAGLEEQLLREFCEQFIEFLGLDNVPWHDC